MNTDLAVVERPTIDPAIMEQVVINGDLAKLTPAQRLSYYNTVCESLGLNPATKPFSYIHLNGKLTLYALKDCTEQLRKIHGVSIPDVTQIRMDDLIISKAHARDRSGREDTSTGAVNIAGLKGEALANAIMKSETKAKRRVTLSICGLGMLDESEVDSIPNATVSDVTHQNGTTAHQSHVQPSRHDGRTIDTSTGEITAPAPNQMTSAEKMRKRFWDGAKGSSDLVTAKQIERLMSDIFAKVDNDEIAVPAIKYLHQNPDMEMSEMTQGAHSRLTDMTRHPEAVTIFRTLYAAAVDWLAEQQAIHSEPTNDDQPADDGLPF